MVELDKTSTETTGPVEEVKKNHMMLIIGVGFLVLVSICVILVVAMGVYALATMHIVTANEFTYLGENGVLYNGVAYDHFVEYHIDNMYVCRMTNNASGVGTDLVYKNDMNPYPMIDMGNDTSISQDATLVSTTNYPPWGNTIP